MRRWRGLPARRGRFFTVPPGQPHPHVLIIAARSRRLPRPPRARFFVVPPERSHPRPLITQASRRRLPRQPRGRFAPVPAAAAGSGRGRAAFLVFFP